MKPLSFSALLLLGCSSRSVAPTPVVPDVPATVPRDAMIRATLEHDQRRVQRVDGRYRLWSPAGLRVDVDAGAATFRARAADAPDAWVSLGAARIGETTGDRGPTLVDDVRLSVPRAWGEERFENRLDGVEHLLVVERPTGAALSVRIPVTTSPGVRCEDDGDASLAFRGPDGGVLLRYGGLRVRDAKGRALSSELRCDDAAVVIEADTAAADWPVRVDPLATGSPDDAAPTGQADAGFGARLAAVGDVDGDGYADLLVGAPDWDGAAADEGRAYLFSGSDAGIVAGAAAWEVDPTDQAAAGFGDAVAAAGDVDGDGYADVIVGAPGWDGEAADEGKVWVYFGSAAGLASAPGWTADPTDQASARFGSAVAGGRDLDRDGYGEVLAGAPDWDGAAVDEGRVLGFFATAAGLPSAADWDVSPTALVGAGFGGALAVGDFDGDGDADVAVGASGDNGGCAADEGVVHVFDGAAGSIATAASVELAPLCQSYAHFGGALAAGDFDGDGYADLAGGAADYDGSYAGQGAVVVYPGSATGLGATSTTLASVSQAAAGFGDALAVGDVTGDGYADLAVGAPGYGSTYAGEGRGLLFLGTSSGLDTTAVWTLDPTDQASAAFGDALAIVDADGDGLAELAVGAPGLDGRAAAEGAVWVYDASAEGLESTQSYVTSPANQFYAHLGYSAAALGDVDGDGFSDFVVGAPYYDGRSTDEGRAYVFLGGASTPSVGWYSDPTDDTTAYYGWSVSGAGDLNGDGYADMVVGAPGADGTVNDEGIAYVYYGSAAGFAATADWTAEPIDHDADFGAGVAGVGDVNGDGYADLAIGAPDDTWHPTTGSGTVWVYAGSATGLGATALATLSGDAGSSNDFGATVAKAGDVDGDGYGDLAVGSPGYSRDNGRFYVFLGGEDGPSTGTGYSPTTDSDAATGTALAAVGDADGDGYDDLAVGIPNEDGSGVDVGIVYVFSGGPTGLDATPAWQGRPSSSWNIGIGGALGVGDFDGDGYRDLAIGAPTYGGYDGKVFVYAGTATGYSTSVAWSESPMTDDAFGSSLAAGDYDDDGYCDLAIGEPDNESSATDEGAVYVYDGGGEDGYHGVPRGLTQCESDGVTARGAGATFTSGGIVLGANAIDVGGDGVVALEAEIEPLGTAFDGEDLALGDDVGVVPGAVATVEPEVAGGTRYHWRARLVAPSGVRSRWYVFGDNLETDADLRVCGDADGDGYDGCDGDCDDRDAAVHPGATEICDAADDDCDGATPAGEEDGDGDGSPACEDCDDADPARAPGFAEACDGVDDDCDGAVPSDETDGDGDGALACDDCDDADATRAPGLAERCDGLDGDCDGALPDDESDADGDGFMACDLDCDDADAAAYAGAAERCDGADDDCDGVVPADEADADGDGVSTCASDCDDADATRAPGVGEACDGIDGDCDGAAPDEDDADGDGQRVCAGDCDDADAAVYLGAAEACDGRDDDCDGALSATEGDADGDGALACADDCDDTDATVSPSASEACNGRDDDCDGAPAADEADGDGDGVRACAGDCDDADAAVLPAAAEACDGRDDDCDGLVDEDDVDDDADGVRICDGDCDDADDAVHPGVDEDCADGVDDDCDGTVDLDEDQDGDGHGSCSGDCDDQDPDLSPDAVERCDAVDQDCDGAVDEDFDVDGDGWTTCAGDCRDRDPAISPGAEEACADGTDDDCDGLIDGDDPACAETGETGRPDTGETGRPDSGEHETAETAEPDTGGPETGEPAESAGPDDTGAPSKDGCGCDATPSAPAALGLVALAWVGRRRRAGEPGAQLPAIAPSTISTHSSSIAARSGASGTTYARRP